MPCTGEPWDELQAMRACALRLAQWGDPLVSGQIAQLLGGIDALMTVFAATRSQGDAQRDTQADAQADAQAVGTPAALQRASGARPGSANEPDAAALFSLEGRRALVTGASSGIGLHLSGVLARAGARVVLAARRTARIEAAAREFEARGLRAASVFVDVTDASSIGPAFDAAERALGGPVDLLVNNAGVLYVKRFLDQSEADVTRVFETNLKGAFLVAQEAARRMVPLGRGAIVNVASTAGLRAGGLLASYNASKAGLVHLTRTMALELAGKGIRVNALCPGNIETEMQDAFAAAGFHERMLERTPQRRFGTPADLDGPVLLLASDAGRYMTGAVVAVDGGQLLSWM